MTLNTIIVLSSVLLFFFFQAEDGIRDVAVTGVQTCALPISVTSVDMPRLQSLLAYLVLHCAAPLPRAHLAYLMWPDSTDAQALTNLRNAKIGRASCRERV